MNPVRQQRSMERMDGLIVHQAVGGAGASAARRDEQQEFGSWFFRRERCTTLMKSELDKSGAHCDVARSRRGIDPYTGVRAKGNVHQGVRAPLAAKSFLNVKVP